MRFVLLILFLFSTSAHAAKKKSCESLFTQGVYAKFDAYHIRRKQLDALATQSDDGMKFIKASSRAMDFLDQAPDYFWQALAVMLPLYDQEHDNFATLYAQIPAVLGIDSQLPLIRRLGDADLQALIHKTVIASLPERSFTDESIDIVRDFLNSALKVKTEMARPAVDNILQEFPSLKEQAEQVANEMRNAEESRREAEEPKEKFDDPVRFIVQSQKLFDHIGLERAITKVLNTTPRFELALVEQFEASLEDLGLEVSAEQVLNGVVKFLNAQQVTNPEVRSYVARLFVSVGSRIQFSGSLKEAFRDQLTRQLKNRRDTSFSRPESPAPSSPRVAQVSSSPVVSAAKPKVSRDERMRLYEQNRAGQQKAPAQSERKQEINRSEVSKTEERLSVEVYADNDLRRFIEGKLPYDLIEADKVYVVPAVPLSGNGLEVFQIVFSKAVIKSIRQSDSPDTAWEQWLTAIQKGTGVRGSGFERTFEGIARDLGFSWWLKPAGYSAWRIFAESRDGVWYLTEMFKFR